MIYEVERTHPHTVFGGAYAHCLLDPDLLAAVQTEKSEKGWRDMAP